MPLDENGVLRLDVDAAALVLQEALDRQWLDRWRDELEKARREIELSFRTVWWLHETDLRNRKETG